MDTEGNFRPERVEAIAERFGLDPTETLENVIVTRVFNHEQQIERAHVSLRWNVCQLSIHQHTKVVTLRVRWLVGLNIKYCFVLKHVGVPCSC